jgi:hypothetical protein
LVLASVACNDPGLEEKKEAQRGLGHRCEKIEFETWKPIEYDYWINIEFPMEARLPSDQPTNVLLRIRDTVVVNHPEAKNYGPDIVSLTRTEQGWQLGRATEAEWDAATKVEEKPSKLCQDRPSCGDREGYRAPTFSCLGKALRKSGKLGPSRVMVSPNQLYVAVASYTGDEGCMKSGIWGPVEPWIDDYFVDIFDLKTGERIAGMKWSLRRNGASDYQQQWRWIGDRFFAFPMDEYHQSYAFCAMPGEANGQ